MLVIPEIQLLEIIDKLLNAVQADFKNKTEKQTILSRLFEGRKVQKFDFFKQAQDLFIDRGVDHPRRIKTRIFFDASVAATPTIHITLPSEETGDDGLGVDAGFQPNISEKGQVTQVFNRRFDTLYHIVITSANTFEVILIYHLLKAMLITTFVQLEFAGLSNPKLSGQDLQIYQELAPPNIFIRGLGLRVSYDAEIPSLFSEDEIKEIFFEPKIINTTKI